MKQAKTAGKWWIVNLLTLALFSFFSVSLSAQTTANKTITGRVTSIRTDSAIGYASVTVKGTSRMVTTGPAGEFKIQAHAGDVLVVSFVGYKAREVKVGDNDKNLTISLSEDQTNLQDVVVVGYGKMKKSDMSSAVLTISTPTSKKRLTLR